MKSRLMNDKKIYSSFSDINRDLQILELEKKIAFEKMKIDIEDVKRSISPSHIVSKAWHNVSDGAIHMAQKLLGN